jgi:hypothetical protein
VAVEVLRRLRHAVLLDVAGRSVDLEPKRQQVALDELGLARRRHADGHVGLAHAEVELAVVEHQVEAHVGIELEELLDARRQPQRAQRHGRGHLEQPFGPILAFAELGLGHRQLGEDVVGRAVEQLALLGEDEAAGMAVEEGDAEALLERAHLPAHRRLGEVQRLAGVREAAGLGDRVKDA